MVHLHDPLADVEQITVYGLGWTGVTAACLLARLGKRVIATDSREARTLEAALAALEAEHGVSLPAGVEIRTGAHEAHGSGAVVLTQSVKHHDRAVRATLDAGVRVIPEVELAASALSGTGVELVAIGGTDGKTTTTRLAGHIVSAQRMSRVGGNSWEPLSAVVMELVDALAAGPAPAAPPILVAEVSAFQLPPWSRFSPRGGAVTNVAEDHVEEYFGGSWTAYVEAKRATVASVARGGWATLNADDPTVIGWAPELERQGVRVVRTSLASRPVYGHADAAFRANGELRLRLEGQETGLLYAEEVPLLGDHNLENVLTAVGLLAPLGLDLDAMRQSIRTFTPPHHRLERVCGHGAVEVYDDSKATNVHASLAGLASFGRRSVVAIVGGVDKGLELDTWVEALRARARAVVVIGELRTRLLRDYAERLPSARPAASMEEAVEAAMKLAEPGDVVLLTPACSSFDMFTSYAHRGEVFQEIARAWRP